MMRTARRTIATALILSLFVSMAPPEAAAIIIRATPHAVNTGAVKTVLPGAAVSVVAPLNAAVLTPSLDAAALLAHAPALRPAVLPVHVPNDAPQALGVPALPTALPDAVAVNETSPAATPVAAAPKEARTLLGSLKGLLSRGTPQAGVVPDLDKSGEFFDGVATKKAEAASVFSTQGGATQWVLRRFNEHVEKRGQDHDGFGGPKPLGPTTTSQKLGYGLKWGLNMVGIVALYDLALRPVLAAAAWPSLLGDQLLESFGRVALLVDLGPADISNALSLAPGAFLGMSLPLMVGMEEITYRVLSFLPAFVVLALTRPVLNGLAGQLGKIPNHAGVRGVVQSVMRLIGGTVAWYAYPLAAVMAAFSFGAAHFAAWGVDPYVFFVQFTLGLVLTRLAYKSESLIPSIIAHLTFNLAVLGAPLLLALNLPSLATGYGLLASIGGMVFLLYNYLVDRKDKAAAKKGLFAGAGASLSIAVLAAGLVFGAAQHTGQGPTMAGWNATRAAMTFVQDAVPAPALTPASAATEPAAAARESRADVIARVAPSVFRVRPRADSSGTGFIISPQGLAVSNAHVVGAVPVGGFVMVDIPGAPPLKAKVLAVNHDKDIALLQLPRHPAGSWKALTIAKGTPRVGEETLAIGYPLDLDQTVTRGIVSGLGRHLNLYVAHIQTDASINPGNSGGPLFNEAGEVLGINTAIKSPNGGSVGLGFSITGQDLTRAVAQYAALRNIDSGRIGVAINLSDPLKPEAGLAIEYVYHGSGAQASGLRRGDLIIGVGGALLLSGGEDAAKNMAAALAQTAPGQKLAVTILRGDQKIDVEVVIDAKASHPGR